MNRRLHLSLAWRGLNYYGHYINIVTLSGRWKIETYHIICFSVSMESKDFMASLILLHTSPYVTMHRNFFKFNINNMNSLWGITPLATFLNNKSRKKMKLCGEKMSDNYQNLLSCYGNLDKKEIVKLLDVTFSEQEGKDNWPQGLLFLRYL